MWKVLISSQKGMKLVINKFVLLRFCYLYNILPWVQLDVQETYITTANFLRPWQKHELGFIECPTLEGTQGQWRPACSHNSCLCNLENSHFYSNRSKRVTVSDWVPKKNSANFESDTFLWFAYVVNMSKICNIFGQIQNI